VARRQLRNLDSPCVIEAAGADEQEVRSFAHKACEGRIDLAAGLGIEDLDLQPLGCRGRLHVALRPFIDRASRRVDEHGDPSCARHEFAQQFQPLCSQLAAEEINARQVAAWPGETGDKTTSDRVVSHIEDDGDRSRCRLSRKHGRGTERSNHAHPPVHEIGRQLRQPIDFILGESVFDRRGFALGEPGFSQACAKSAQRLHEPIKRLAVKESDHRHRRLLRPRHQWPRRRAAEKGDELSPSHACSPLVRGLHPTTPVQENAALCITANFGGLGCPLNVQITPESGRVADIRGHRKKAMTPSCACESDVAFAQTASGTCRVLAAAAMLSASHSDVQFRVLFASRARGDWEQRQDRAGRRAAGRGCRSS
jgi:hypothetical protein